MTPLERDLTKRINEKHTQWMCDAFDLFEMAGLTPATAAQAISTVVCHTIAALLAVAEKPDLDEFSTILKLEVARLRLDHDRKNRTGDR